VKAHEDAVLVVTDVHYGKATQSYSPDVTRQRMEEVAARIESITAMLQTSIEIDRLHIMFLGDLADGADIYPSQTHHQEISNPDQQSIEAAQTVFAPFVRRMALTFPEVHNYFVYGNHGRTGKRMHEAANWDITCYRYLSLILGDANPRIITHTENLTYPIRVVNVRGHGHLLYHGNEIRSFANIPWYGMMNRLLRWNNSSLPDWRVAHMGHFHSCGRWHINQFEMFSSGTMVTHDEWAFQVLGWESSNRWWFMGVSDERPVTWSFDIQTATDIVDYASLKAVAPPAQQEVKEESNG
jgi:hypothetical protein